MHYCHVSCLSGAQVISHVFCDVSVRKFYSDCALSTSNHCQLYLCIIMLCPGVHLSDLTAGHLH